MSTLKVNTLDTRSGTDITVTTGKTVVIPAGGTISVAGTQTVTGAHRILVLRYIRCYSNITQLHCLQQ